MRIHRSLTRLAATLGLGLLLACGGGSNPAPAPASAPPAPLPTGFQYTDPTGTGWRLMKDPSSTATHLVLNLVGPDAEKGRGVGFNLQSDGLVTFSRYPDGSYVQDAGVFQLGNLDAFPGAYDAVLRNAGLKKGGTVLSVGLFQKDRRQAAPDLNVPLCQVALDFDGTKVAQARPAVGATVALAVVKAKVIPEDIGTMPPDPSAFDADYSSVIAKSRLNPIQIAVGRLAFQ